MEIVNVDLIIINIIVVFCIFIILINGILPGRRIKNLNNIVLVQDKNYELYIELIDKYIKKEGYRTNRNAYLVMKTTGYRKLEKWNELIHTVEIIEINQLIKPRKNAYCIGTLSMFVIDRVEEGRIMADKLKSLSKSSLSKLQTSEVVFAVQDFHSIQLDNSYTTFKELLNKNQYGKYSNFLKPVIYFYLGLIDPERWKVLIN